MQHFSNGSLAAIGGGMPSRCGMVLALCALVTGCSPSSEPPSTQRGNGGSDVASKNMIGAAANGGGGGSGVVPMSTTDNPRQLTGGTVAAPTNGKGSGTGCTGLQCQQHQCQSGNTTISGRVYDPAGKNPLYNVAVYVPNETPQALPLGASCAKCDSLYTGHPVVTSLTDADGKFTIKDAPDGDNIPLVVQIGKWRMQVKVPHVEQCTDTPVTDKLRLPRNHIEGDIPAIAISTGAADTLECLLRRIGVDASEYVPGDSDMGRVHIFQGSKGMSGRRNNGGGEAPTTSPAAPSSPSALWNDQSSLMKYDIVLLSCEGQETQMMNQQALHDYASAGGRVFASHFHYAWFNSGPYANENLATWSAGSNDMGDIGATIVTSFPKGMALQQWLTDTGALVNGELPIKEARHNADVSKLNTPSQAWILADGNAMPPMATEYLSFNTPTDAAQQADGPGYCGRVVFSDLHVGAASNDDPSQPVPSGCGGGDLSPQEKALEFMLFDLSACVIPDDRPPTPPPALN